MKITNNHGISLPVAVWLLHDDYDYVYEPNYISATSLLKSTKQIVLSTRVASADKEMDLSDLIALRFGHAVHDAMEKAWHRSGRDSLKKLGYPDNIVNNLLINPTPEELAANPNAIVVWIERRTVKEINGYRVAGKFDQVVQGRLMDTKTTSVWSYILGKKDEDYQLQLSIYRWLNPDIITEDFGYIQFVFTDWQRREAMRDPQNYPQIKTKEYVVPLLSVKETETWIKAKLDTLSRAWTLPEEDLPPCNDKELWRGPTVYKYYADATKTDGRSTRNFDAMSEAQTFMASKGGKGTIRAVAGEVKACEYCPAFSICKQKDQYYARSE